MSYPLKYEPDYVIPVSVYTDKICYPLMNVPNELYLEVFAAAIDAGEEAEEIDIDEVVAEFRVYLQQYVSNYHPGLYYRVELTTMHGAHVLKLLRTDASAADYEELFGRFREAGMPGLSKEVKERC